jgi:hypothetical protein
MAFDKYEQPPFQIIRLTGPVKKNIALVKLNRLSSTEVHCKITTAFNKAKYDLMVVESSQN